MTHYWKVEKVDSFRAGKYYQPVKGHDECDGFHADVVGRSFTQKRNAERFCKLANREIEKGE